MKRQRGRGRKPGGGGGSGGGSHYQHNNQPNRTLESNGPDTKVRGPASHIFERYLQLARDAASSGDRVLSENYLQHADHYFRLVRSMQPAQPAPQPGGERFNGESYQEGDDENAQDNDRSEGAEASADRGDQPNVEFPQGQQEQQQQQQPFDREAGRRRGRGRRDRFRPEGEGAGPEAQGERTDADDGGERRPREGAEGREGGQERRERQPRERDGERDTSGPEGFSNGPKPAFLRGGDSN